MPSSALDRRRSRRRVEGAIHGRLLDNQFQSRQQIISLLALRVLSDNTSSQCADGGG
jgi:hypothetical protein